MILKDNELVCRAIDENDASCLLEMINDAEIENAVVGWSFPVSMIAQKEWIANLGKDKSNIRYAIDLGNGMIGMASLSAIDFKNKTANLNVKLLKNARGKGYASRAIKLLIKYCFEELNLNCLTAKILAENAASNNLFTNLGFYLEGSLRKRVFKGDEYHDLNSYSYLRDEYDKRNW